MKKFSQSLFVFVAMLVFTSVAFAKQVLTNLTFTPVEARDILASPEKFVQTYEVTRKSDFLYDHFVKPEQIARQLLDLVKDDQKFLQQVYAIYAPIEASHNGPYNDMVESIISSSYMAYHALRCMNAGDDAYFKQAFEQATGKSSYLLRIAALSKIKDLTYVKKLITEDAESNEGLIFPNLGYGYLVMRGEELYKDDPQFVDALAESAVSTLVREAAIRATSNRTILQKYAGLRDIDQYKYQSNSEAAHRAFVNSCYQHAATEKLARLGKK